MKCLLLKEGNIWQRAPKNTDNPNKYQKLKYYQLAKNLKRRWLSNRLCPKHIRQTLRNYEYTKIRSVLHCGLLRSITLFKKVRALAKHRNFFEHTKIIRAKKKCHLDIGSTQYKKELIQ